MLDSTRTNFLQTLGATGDIAIARRSAGLTKAQLRAARDRDPAFDREVYAARARHAARHHEIINAAAPTAWQAANAALAQIDKHAESLARRRLMRAQAAKVLAETAALTRGADEGGDVQLVVRVRRTAPDATD